MSYVDRYKTDPIHEGECNSSKFVLKRLQPRQLFTGDDELAETFSDPFISNQESKQLYNCPVKCPVTNCIQAISSSSVLTHIIREHGEQGNDLPSQEIYAGKRAIIEFDPIMLSEKSTCIGLLLYGGLNPNAKTPVERGICNSNKLMPPEYQKYKDFLPILVMGCITCFNQLLGASASEIAKADPFATELYIWLASIESTKPILGLLSAYNKKTTIAKSSLVKTRPLHKLQDPILLQHFDNCGLRLSHGEVMLLCDNGKKKLQIEICIQEPNEQ